MRTGLDMSQENNQEDKQVTKPSAEELRKQVREAESEVLPKGGSGNSTAICYAIQVRCSKGCGPKEIRGATTGMGKTQVTDSRWETLSFPKGNGGVPASTFVDEYAR